MLNTQDIRAKAHAAFATAAQRPTPLGRFVAYMIAITLAVLAILITLPLIILFFLAAGVFLAGAAAARWLIRARQPNGTLDGRRNVRVRGPAGDSPIADSDDAQPHGSARGTYSDSLGP